MTRFYSNAQFKFTALIPVVFGATLNSEGEFSIPNKSAIVATSGTAKSVRVVFR